MSGQPMQIGISPQSEKSEKRSIRPLRPTDDMMYYLLRGSYPESMDDVIPVVHAPKMKEGLEAPVPEGWVQMGCLNPAHYKILVLRREGKKLEPKTPEA